MLLLSLTRARTRARQGIASDDLPRTIFPSVVGHLRHKGVLADLELKDCYVGDEAQSMRGILSLKRPVECASITDWDSMEKVSWFTNLVSRHWEIRITEELVCHLSDRPSF